MISPYLGMAAVLGALSVLFVAIKVFGKRVHPEIARKALHVGMGTICLSLPWVFKEMWPVIALGIVAAISLGILRSLPRLRSSLGTVLHGVERASLGEFYFIGGAVALFCISFGKPPVFFVLPMMWLTFADATAALIGIRYGTIRYDTFDGKKSLEGSTAFVSVTFMTTFVALVYAGHVDATRDLFIAAILGLLAMMLEAVAWNGIDNLVIPIFGYAFLAVLIDRPLPFLILDAVVLGALFALTRMQADRTTLSVDAQLGAILSVYTFWVLGGWAWLIAPVLLFLKDKYESAEHGERHRHNVHAVMATTGIGLAVAILNVIAPNPSWFLIYTASLGIQLAMFDTALRAGRSPKTMVRNVLVSGLVSFAIVFVPYVAVAWGVGLKMPLLAALVAAPFVFVFAAALFARVQPGIDDCPRDFMRWVRQDSVAAAGTVVLLSIVRFA